MKKGNTQKKRNDETLFDIGDGAPARGAVYRDVNRQIAALRKAGTLDPDERAGFIAQARSLAAVIDRASGLGGRKQETYALAALHKQLAELLALLAGEAVANDDDKLAALLGADPPTPAP